MRKLILKSKEYSFMISSELKCNYRTWELEHSISRALLELILSRPQHR